MENQPSSDSKFELAEAVGTSLIYVGPAFAALGFKSFINEFIYKIDFGLLAISKSCLIGFGYIYDP